MLAVCSTRVFPDEAMFGSDQLLEKSKRKKYLIQTNI